MKTIALYISTHLLPVVVLCFIAGIWCVPLLDPHFNLQLPATVTFILLSVFTGSLLVRCRTSEVFLLLPFCTLLAGYLHGHANFQIPGSAQHVYNVISKDSEAILTGSLEEMVTYNGKMSKAIVKLDSIRLTDMKYHQPAHGLVRLSLMGKWPTQMFPGDGIVVRAQLKRPRSFHTPGVFDYAQFLAQKDIWITGFIRSPLFIKKLDSRESGGNKYSYLAERLRTHIGSYLDQNLEPRFASIYRALLLGDRSSVSPSDLELFKASGTFHILAISGLHIAVIATLLYLIFYWLLSRSEFLLLHFSVRKIVAIGTIPILIGYALLAGMNSPVTRAVTMSSIVLIALCTDRKKSPAPLVAGAAFIMLIFDPLQLFTVSFQLSFAAIIGILFVLPMLQKHIVDQVASDQKHTSLKMLYTYTISALLVSVAATLATALITVSVFNRISTIGPLANLLLEPLICLWALPAGIIALPFIWLSPEIANVLLHFGTYGIHAALYVAKTITDLPFASLFIPDPSLYRVLLYFLFIYICLSGFLIHAKKTTILIFSLPFLLTIIFHNNVPFFDRQDARVSFIDVGQGSATLIETGDSTILIDGGGSSYSTRSVGETVIAPFLWDKGIHTVETIIVTHPDADHYNGLEYVLEHFSPHRIWVRDLKGHDKKYRQFIDNAQKRGIKITVPVAGEIIHEGGLTLECLANLKDQHFDKTRGGNSANTGLIVKGCFKEHCFLFPGDINVSMEKFLLAREIDLKAETLLSAHHGSKTSNSTDFLSTVGPRYAIVSARGSSKGYFPHQGFLDKCASLNIDIFNTAEDGTIEFKMGDGNTTLSTTEKFQENPLYPLVLTSRYPTQQETEVKKPE